VACTSAAPLPSLEWLGAWRWPWMPFGLSSHSFILSCPVLCAMRLHSRYCLIPMGGVLPTIPQRVLGIGGTAGMVHPSTGQACQAVWQLPAVH